MTRRILESLTVQQREAVQHVDGPLLMLAGPGSGKTRVITHRIAYLIEQGVDPRMILALTFTNKAADEMKSRVRQLAPDAQVWIGTFHRFCSRLLRRYARHVGLDSNFTIYDSSDAGQALKRAIANANIQLSMTSPEQLRSHIGYLKNHLITADEYSPNEQNHLGHILGQVYPAYESELLSANAVDFDDLLLHVVRLLQQSPELRASLDESFRYVMVDEYQDTNLAQYAIVRGLSNDYPNLAVTGDPDQSIYGWRGANLNNILDFESDYPDVRTVRLEQNYRSTPNILNVAQALIANNQRRKPKDLFTDNPAGAPVRLVTYPSYKDEANGVVASIDKQIRSTSLRARDFAVFYRVNALSRPLEDAFRTFGIPYQIVQGVEFYQRKEIKDVIAYLRLIHNPMDNNAFERIINVPRRGIGKATVSRLIAHAQSQGLSLLEAARQSEDIETMGKSARAKLVNFARDIDCLSVQAGDSVETLLRAILDATEYLELLRRSDAVEDADRAANVEELLAAAAEFDDDNVDDDALRAFLERTALVNDVDGWDEGTDRVALMTLHAAKGLEFDVVYIVGVEQGLLPHERNQQDIAKQEEERRLFFVGITRAKQRLQISHATVRSIRGGPAYTVPSQFLVELPRSEMEVTDANGAPVSHLAAGGDEVWQDDPEPRRRAQRQRARDTAKSTAKSRDASTAKPSLTMMTAAQLVQPASGDAAGPVDPACFKIGMTVIHPEYGPGKVSSLTGQGKQRTAAINFPTAGSKTIVLAKSQLRPASSET